ncbi:MAG: glycosyl hydrolase family 18 protein [Clostridia bacterium]
MKKLWQYVILILIISVFAAAAVIAYDAILDYIKEKYLPNQSVEEYYSEEYTDLVINFSHIEYETPVKIINGEILVRYEVIKEFIDPYIYYDEIRAKVIVTTKDKVIYLTENSLFAQINKKDLQLDTASQRYEGILYVPIGPFAYMWNINAKYIESKDVVIIESFRNHEYTATVNISDAQLRKGPSIKEPIYVKNIQMGQLLYVNKVIGDWTYLMTADGIAGYVETKYLNIDVTTRDIVIDYEEKELYLPDYIILTWHYVYSSSVTSVPYYADVNVISPTFFTVIDEKGTISSSASMKYMENAHKRGYTVWPLINNIFANRDQISTVLGDSEARRHVIDQILAYAYIYKFDGINVDFENLYLSDKDNLTQFIRELVPLAHEMNLAVSIDVGIPGGSEGYSLCYDHEQLGKTADYVMVMTYDQYWSSHESGGSQAQLSWVEANLKNTLKLIPSDKLILGIPAYTRLWKTDQTGKVTLSKTLTADQVVELVEEKQITPVWEEERDGYISGQYYIEYREGNDLYRAWVEDDASARLKAMLAAKYKLRGVCIWMMSQTNKTVWEAILEGFNTDIN